MIADREGSLWVGTAGNGINRTQYPEHTDAKNVQGMGNSQEGGIRS